MRLRSLVLSAFLACAPVLGWPQIPQPHTPGTICATPQFWCYATYPGPVGARCACRAPKGGWVYGVLV